MPPSSRGQVPRLLRLRAQAYARHTSSTALPELPKTPARLTKAVPNPRATPPDSPSPSPSTTPTLPKHDPKAPYVPFRGPPGAPSIGVRLVNAFSPALRPFIRFILQTIPWIPPFYLALMHTPVNIIPARGQSMNPLLNGDHDPAEPNVDDWVLVDVRNGVKASLRRGMVVVYRSPHNPERWGVKRVIALQGDKVTPKPGYPGGDEPLIVPWGHVWVEGDAEDRDKSLDSNWFGPISRNLIIGRVTWVLWPWKHVAQVKWKDAELPDRLEVNAVHLHNPDALDAMDVFRNGYAQGILARLRNPATGAAEHAYHSGRALLVHLLKTSRDEVEKHDPETAALAAALHNEVKLVLETKGKLPVPISSTDLPRGSGPDLPDVADTEAALRSLYREAIAMAEKTGQVPERAEAQPTVVPEINSALSAPYVQEDTPSPVVS
jgi:mitochondrial inner membrane protease subunit 2